MKYNFDEVIDRKGTGALKTDRLEERFGRSDLLDAWVADMDFATPDFIINDIRKRLEHPILGYTVLPEDYISSIIDWEKELHEWVINPEWITFIPGIVKGIGMVINFFSRPGDKIIIMPPVYHPFRITTEENDREIINVPLILKEGKYEMDFETLERLKVDKGILIFSNPHNPGGRMWSKNELKKLADICFKKNIIVISDEIHGDMGLWDNQHIPYASVSEEAASNSITFGAPSKTFNIPGIVSSFVIIPDEEIRNPFFRWLKANEFDDAPLFSAIATVSAYRKGKEWRKQMLKYVESNILFVKNFFDKEIPEIKVLLPEASFLIWLDCRGLGLTQKQLTNLFINVARVALNDGEMFGKEGIGFLRLNVATPKKKLKEILERIKFAVSKLKSEE